MNNSAKACVIVAPTNISTYKNASKLNVRFLLYKKECISYLKYCYIYYENDSWVLSYYKDNQIKYNFKPNNYNNFIDILNNLGLKNGKYRVKLLNYINDIFNTVHFNFLEEALEWCYNTEIRLKTVNIEYNIN